MFAKALVSVAALLAILFTAATPAAAQEETRRSGSRGTVGAVIGAAAGATAAFIFYRVGNCHKDNDWYDNVWVDCVAPASAMVAGGATAGFFIGRAMNRRPRTAPPLSRTPARIMPALEADIPPMRLHILQPNRQPSHRPYLTLFTAQLNEGRARVYHPDR